MMGFINYLINGISLGSVYAIIALGYTMVYGIAKMLNFAHGDIIMVGSYTVFITTRYLGMPTFLSVLLAVVVCTLLGIVIERVAYKPLRDASPLSVLITAIGVSYLLQNVALLLFGADTKSFTSVVTFPAIKLALFKPVVPVQRTGVFLDIPVLAVRRIIVGKLLTQAVFLTNKGERNRGAGVPLAP